MATYGRGQMLGAGIDPRMFVQDYSGFARAGAIQGQGMAQLGADIGNIGKQFGEFKKEQAEQEKQVKSAELVAKAISDSFPSLAPMAQEAMFILGDKNNPLSDRLAAAQAIETSLKIGSGLLAQQAEQGLAERRFGLQEREFGMREAAAGAPPESKWTSFESKRKVNKKEYSVRLRQNQFGVVEGPDGKQYRTINDFWAGKPMESFSAGGEPAFPTGESYINPVLLPSTTSRVDDTPTDDTMPIELGDGSPTPSAAQEAEFNRKTTAPEEFPITEPQEAARQIEGALEEGEVYIPPGAVETSKPEGQRKTFRRATPQEAAEYGVAYGQFNSDGQFFPIKVPSGMSIESDGQGGIKVVQGPGVGQTPKEQKAEQAKKVSVDQNMMDLYFLEDRTKDMVEGVAGAAGRIVAEKIPATQQAENKAVIDRLSSRLTLGSLQAIRETSPTGGALGNVSDKDIQILRDSATSLRNAQSPAEFQRELIRLQNLQYETIYGDENFVKKELKEGRITQQEFDFIESNRPQKFLDSRGQIRIRTTREQTQKPVTGLTEDEQKLLDKYPE